jgi:hypothetical protein
MVRRATSKLRALNKQPSTFRKAVPAMFTCGAATFSPHTCVFYVAVNSGTPTKIPPTPPLPVYKQMLGDFVLLSLVRTEIARTGETFVQSLRTMYGVPRVRTLPSRTCPIAPSISESDQTPT